MIFGPFLGLILFLIYPTLGIVAVVLLKRGVQALEKIARIIERMEREQATDHRFTQDQS